MEFGRFVFQLAYTTCCADAKDFEQQQQHHAISTKTTTNKAIKQNMLFEGVVCVTRVSFGVGLAILLLGLNTVVSLNLFHGCALTVSCSSF
eukprot:1353378-Amphidinium_carterae.2